MLRRILIADDSEPSREALAALLGQTGFVVEMASDGSDALQRLLHSRFDLTLLDFHMPLLNGLQVVAQLRQAGRPVPSILMTGHPSREIEMAALEAGVLAMLRKPIPAEILRITVQQAISGRLGPSNLDH